MPHNMMGCSNTILLIDDDRDFRNTLKEILEGEGLLTEEAVSGQEGLERCRAKRYDIILLDLVMPGMDGLETLREIKQAVPNAKVILITAFATIDSAVNAMKLGATDYMSKSFNVMDFVMTIRRILEELRFESTIKELELDQILGSLANPIRRAVVKILAKGEHPRLTDLMRSLVISDHAKLTFHLKNMQEYGIIEKRADRTYALTAQGVTVMESLREMTGKLSGVL